MKKIVFLFTLLVFVRCTSKVQEKQNVNIVGAMKNVMWKGKLGSSINLDTIADKKGLYGLGPVSYLTGELLINNGKSYVSKVINDTTMIVEKSFDISAPFFVYSNINNWHEIKLPTNVKTIKDVEKFTKNQTTNFKKPFAFKLIGQIAKAVVHIQNLPQGSKVSSPDEAHQGQTNFTITNTNCEIIGFFSTEHQGVFTHHDSFVHMHLITKDETKMGHLDELEIGEMKLYLPKK